MVFAQLFSLFTLAREAIEYSYIFTRNFPSDPVLRNVRLAGIFPRFKVKEALNLCTREGENYKLQFITLSHSEMECRDFYCSYNGHAHPLPSQFHTLPLLFNSQPRNYKLLPLIFN